MKSQNTALLILTALFCSVIITSAQDGYIARKDSLQSSVLNQKRILDIRLPDGYEGDTDRFPVIYVLDADGRDQHTVPTARFLFLNSKMPKAI